jgi:hypothetical protein
MAAGHDVATDCCSACQLLDIAMVVTRGEGQRAIYLSTYLKTGSKVRAAAASGLKDHRTLQKLIKRLDDTHTLAHSPGAGRPIKYTASMMKATYKLLLDATEPMDSTELFQQAISAAGLQGPVNKGNFYRHLRSWLKQRGCTLVLNERGTVFAITKQDAIARVKHCEHMLRTYSSGVGSFIVSDETAIDENPPPPGMTATSAIHQQIIGQLSSPDPNVTIRQVPVHATRGSTLHCHRL